MNKKEIYQRVLDCRLIADEVRVAISLFPTEEKLFELSWCVENILDDIDYFLDRLHKMGVVAE